MAEKKMTPVELSKHLKETLTPDQKRDLLTDMIERMARMGYGIKQYLGRPLNYFDYGKIQEAIDELEAEENEQNGNEYDI